MRIPMTILIASMLILTSCTGFDAYSHAIVQKKIQYNNGQAVLYATANCDMALGAFLRMFSFEQQKALLTICNANQDIVDYLELLEASENAVNDNVTE